MLPEKEIRNKVVMGEAFTCESAPKIFGLRPFMSILLTLYIVASKPKIGATWSR